ncbi:MAG: phytanoyl-CoA dioxygenase family protein [Elusimicrobia bacterium]|nr:phytanoyl-CoA dioxygenase family protein [Elusimicrobiota bacterium]
MAMKTVKFSKRDAPRASARTLKAVRAAMARDGAVVFDGLFPLPLLKKIRREVLRRHESGELRARGLVRDIAGRYAAVLPLQGPLLSPRLYADPRLADCLSVLLGADYCLGSVEAVVARPGAVEQHQHIDGPIRFDRALRGRRIPYSGDLSDLPPYAVTLATPLCEQGPDNGPTALWPGSHRAALRARPPSEAEVLRKFRGEVMTGPFGRSYLFDYRLFHGGLPNMTREPRVLLVIVFVRPWFRDPNLADVRPGLAIAPRALARVPEKHRHLFRLAPAARRALWA